MLLVLTIFALFGAQENFLLPALEAQRLLLLYRKEEMFLLPPAGIRFRSLRLKEGGNRYFFKRIRYQFREKLETSAIVAHKAMS